MHKNDRWRQFLLPRLRRGELSVTQAALAAGITRQAVSRWCKGAGIRIKESEARYVLEVQLAFERWAGGKASRGGQSKATLRQSADQAKRDWDAQHGQDS